MNLQELFRQENVLVGFEAADKWEAIRGILEHLDAGGDLPEGTAPDLLDAVLQREQSMSTTGEAQPGEPKPT